MPIFLKLFQLVFRGRDVSLETMTLCPHRMLFLVSLAALTVPARKGGTLILFALPNCFS